MQDPGRGNGTILEKYFLPDYQSCKAGNKKDGNHGLQRAFRIFSQSPWSLNQSHCLDMDLPPESVRDCSLGFSLAGSCPVSSFQLSHSDRLGEGRAMANSGLVGSVPSGPGLCVDSFSYPLTYLSARIHPCISPKIILIIIIIIATK